MSREMDKQYMIHMNRKTWATHGRMDRLLVANKQGWKNPKPKQIKNVYELYTLNGPLYPIVYHWRMPWKYGTRWVKIKSTGHFELASVKKNIVQG